MWIKKKNKNTVETLSVIAWHLPMRVRVVFIIFTTFHPLGRCIANEINLFCFFTLMHSML